jgi:hypothetical protein
LQPVTLSMRVGRYAEQPYTQRAGSAPRSFERVETALRDRLAKWRAIAQYGSQLHLLGMRHSPTRGPHVLAFADESVAWQ